MTKRLRGLLEPRQVFWAPIVYRDDQLDLLRLDAYDPVDERKSRFRMTPQAEATDAFNHFPVKELELRRDEEMVVFRAKHRSALLFSMPMLQPDVQKQRGNAFLLVPHYSFHDEDPADFKKSVRLFEYSALFHAPASVALRIPDGYFRFDRISVVPRDAMNSPMPYRITTDAYYFMNAWFDSFRSGVLTDGVLQDLITESRRAPTE